MGRSKILCCGTGKVKHWEARLYIQEGQRKTGGRPGGKEPTGDSGVLSYLVKSACTVIPEGTAGPSPGIIPLIPSCQSLATDGRGGRTRRKMFVTGI